MDSRDMSTTISKVMVTSAAAAAIGLGLYAFLLTKSSQSKYGIRQFSTWLRTRLVLRNKQVMVVNTREECSVAIQKILKECKKYKYIGFDCEWRPQTVRGQKQRPVALLQFASPEGSCALLRLCKLGFIPEEVKAVLRDPNLLKVGVAPLDDAKFLFRDYSAPVKGCLDLRHLIQAVNYKGPMDGDLDNLLTVEENKTSRVENNEYHGLGLAKLAEKLLGVSLDKEWRVRCSNWEADTLSSRQIEYAANDALVSALIFAKIMRINLPRWPFRQAGERECTWDDTWQTCFPFIDMGFKAKSRPGGTSGKRNSPKILLNHTKRHSYQVRRRPLYDNCFLQAPDGKTLSTCDTKKAMWYISKGLGHEIKNGDNLTVRLNFEPAASHVEESNGYYTKLKRNICVVCGGNDSFIRKCIVPREYRRFFPQKMISHNSHDVLLMCIHCNLNVDNKANILRNLLAEQCNAPYKKHFLFDSPMSKVRSAATAILRCSDTLPPMVLANMKQLIMEYFQLNSTEDISQSHMELAASFSPTLENEDYSPHGLKVVEYFQAKHGEFTGVNVLEQMWRSHFLKEMQPKFLPELWSVTHKH